MRVSLLLLVTLSLTACGIDGPPTRPLPTPPTPVDLPEENPN